MFDVVLLNDFLKFTESTILKDGIETCGMGNMIWTSEDWTLEVTRALMCDDYKNYLNLPIPNRFINEPAFKSMQGRILEACEYKENCLKILNLIKDKVDNVLIGEIGRGLDLIVSLYVKSNWQNIIGYDRNEAYSLLIQTFFSTHKLPFKFYKGSGYNLNPGIPPKTVFILNHSIDTLPYFYEHKNILYIIRDGKLVKGIL